MASTASVAPATGGSAATAAPDASQTNGIGRSRMKSTSASKSSDGNRKQSPGDGQRRTPQPKAWTSGTNPITQRGSTPIQQNGNSLQPKLATAAKSTPPKEQGLSDRHAHDRLTFILGAAFGSIITVTTKTGDRFEGVMSGSIFQGTENRITLKMTKKQHTPQAGQANGTMTGEAALVGTGPDHAMSIDHRDISDISIPELTPAEPTKVQNGTGSKFQTDTDISRNQSRGERPLQRWVPETGNEVGLSLESGGASGWDQFETNKRMFGTTSTFDENDYTTFIDRSAPSYKKREAEAARIAREIEGSTSTNTHMREERGQALENDVEDEEDKYSGVRRSERNFPPLNSGAPNMYTPPARRPPTGQPTVRGAPVDPAIISAQVSRADGTKKSMPKPSTRAADTSPVQGQASTPGLESVESSALTQAGEPKKEKVSTTGSLTSSDVQDGPSKTHSTNKSVSPQRKGVVENPTEDVENKVLDHFRQFANSEKLKLAEKRRAQASHDRSSKLNDLLKFSQSFKLKTPIPTDLVGILAKDPAKQEQIIEKAKKEVEEVKSAAASPAKVSEPKIPRPAVTAKFEHSAIPPPLPMDRQTFGRGRGGFASTTGRGDRPTQPNFGGRGLSNQFQQRSNGAPQDRKITLPHAIPAPIPIHEGRAPPLGPMIDQSGLSSPQRSSVHTPTSAVSTKFNVKAMEFRPNANAPAFAPAASSNVPSSPASMQRTGSVSRAASPSAFFGQRRPKPTAERPSITDSFNPIKRMKMETQRKESEETNANRKLLFPANGGIPNAYMTGPRWSVADENAEKTYNEVFEKQATPAISPVQSRSSSTHHIPYQHQVPQHLQNGQQTMPQISTPRRTPQHMQGNHFHHPDEAHSRMPMPAGSPQVYASPHVTPGQIVFPSPMTNPAQLAYGQPPYFGAQGNQGPMQMRQYQGTPQFMHTQGGQLAAPVMVQQQSSGPYMNMPQGYNPQMQMYSPNPAHVYPQQNGYPSPGRGAPMMMHQGSQQGHHPGQQMMYGMPGQGGQMIYPQQGGQMSGMRTFPSQQGHYASSPHQQHHFPQRAMSNGYGQMPKMMQQPPMQANQGMPPNAPQPHGIYASTEGAVEEGK